MLLRGGGGRSCREGRVAVAWEGPPPGKANWCEPRGGRTPLPCQREHAHTVWLKPFNLCSGAPKSFLGRKGRHIQKHCSRQANLTCANDDPQRRTSPCNSNTVQKRGDLVQTAKSQVLMKIMSLRALMPQPSDTLSQCLFFSVSLWPTKWTSRRLQTWWCA